jgi:L-fuconolactonase
VWCKISGVATEADHSAWSDDQLRRYIDIAVDAFGFDRVFFGGDWPVATQAITFARWVEVVESALAGSSAAERAKLWRDNAIRFYSLNVGAAIETRGKR